MGAFPSLTHQTEFGLCFSLKGHIINTIQAYFRSNTMDKFNLKQSHKLSEWLKEHSSSDSEWLEEQATEWIEGAVNDHFNVINTDALTENQMKEVFDEWSISLWVDQEDTYISMALRNVIAHWEMEHDKEQDYFETL